MYICVFLCHWLKTVLVLGQHIFISLFNSDYNWGFENSFKIRYDVEQCEFREWKIGHAAVDREKIPRLFLNLVKTPLLAARYQRLVHVTYTVVQIPGAKRLHFCCEIFQ